MKKLWAGKGYLAVGVVIVLFLFVSLISLSSIRALQGNARVVNYVGIVRGATQKLIKEELMGWHLTREDPAFAETSAWYPDDALVARLDSIVDELLTGDGPNNLVVLPDDEYLDNMRRVQAHWGQLKALIVQVRAGDAPDGMFESSQAYFELVNETVFSAERYSEEQVNRSTLTLIAINVIFVLIIVVGVVLFMRSLAVKRRAEALGKVAYVDPLTNMDNRASCERYIRQIAEKPEDMDLAVFMFDMNDLKLTNDFLGHQGGDIVIAKFAEILKQAAAKHGFAGRYGGDEFLAVFKAAGEDTAGEFLAEVREKVDGYNKGQANELEKIKYAAGYVIANARQKDIEDIIHEADNQMYMDKRRLKGR